MIITALIPDDKDHVQPRGNSYTIPGKGSTLRGKRNKIILEDLVLISIQEIQVEAAPKVE